MGWETSTTRDWYYTPYYTATSNKMSNDVQWRWWIVDMNDRGLREKDIQSNCTTTTTTTDSTNTTTDNTTTTAIDTTSTTVDVYCLLDCTSFFWWWSRIKDVTNYYWCNYDNDADNDIDDDDDNNSWYTHHGRWWHEKTLWDDWSKLFYATCTTHDKKRSMGT